MLNVYQAIVDTMIRGESAVLATVISSTGSTPRKTETRMLLRGDGSIVGTIGGGGVEQRVRQEASEVLRHGRTIVVHLDLAGEAEQLGMICGGQMDVLLEVIMPLETIYLLGAGHIAKYVAALGGDLDFRIVIVDPRTGWNDAVRFPEADTLVVQDYAEAFPKLEIRPIDYVIIVTPSHVSDEKCVQLALETPAKYIGMIGSKRKVKLIKEQLQQKGITAVSLKRLHAPIGIDIAAETPAEIAVSILAEIIQIRRSPPTHT